MNNLVSSVLIPVENAITVVGAQFFQTIAAQLLPLATVLTVLMVVLIGANMALGVVRIGNREATQIVLRILLVFLFGLTWANFNAIFDVLTNASSNLAVSFFLSTASSLHLPPFTGTPTPQLTYIAIDGFVGEMVKVVNATIQAQSSIVRAFIAGALYVILSIMIAAFVLIVAFAKIMIAFLLGFAPVAILFTLFSRTQNLFEAWLSALIGYLMYPPAAASIIGVITAIGHTIFQNMGNPGAGLASILPFLVIVFVGIFAMKAIPSAVTNLTGNFNLANITPQALRMASAPLRGTGNAVGQRIGRRVSDTTAGALSGGQTRKGARWNRARRHARQGNALANKLSAMRRLNRS